MQKPVIFLHRAGKHSSYGHKENTVARATITGKHPQVDGFEIDVRLTKDGVPIVHHDRVRGHDLASFRKKYHGDTLAEWVSWLQKHPKKSLYLDTKERIPIDLYFKIIAPVRDRIWIGSRDPWYVRHLVMQKRKTKSNVLIFYMTWNSIFAQTQVAVADYYFRKHKARPDGIHAMYEEVTPVGLRLIHLALIKRLVTAAKKRGYMVSGGTGTPSSVRKQIRFGVDCLMPNHHDHIPTKAI